jgi:mitogen-activated protein kinase 15
LVNKCLEFNPNKRITFTELIKHPYLREFYDESEIIVSEKKVRVPIDDNCRLSLKDYRILIYEQIQKRNIETSHHFPAPLTPLISR